MDPALSFEFCILTLATVYVAYLEFRRTKMALDMSKLSAAIDAMKAERDALKAQVANEQAANQAAVDKAAADATAADQAQVDALTASMAPAEAPAA